MKDYHINIFYSEEDEAYIADIPDLKYCSAVGETPQQALHEVILAKIAWLEAAKTENKTISKPRYRPVIYQIVA
jgi:predicted RNase H-like HicB family nuclease